jgi:hypothetical protein
VSAFAAVPALHGAPPTPGHAAWWLQETLCYLRHLEVTGRAEAEHPDEGAPQRWRATA